MESIASFVELQELVRSEKALLVYVSTPSCGVCASMKPKVLALARGHFPRMAVRYLDAAAVPEAAGQLSVFSVPAVLVFFEGRETVREARNFGIAELGAKIDRYYSMLFED